MLDALDWHFSVDELKEITFMLEIDWSDVPGGTSRERAMELIEFCERRNMTGRLINVIRSERPYIKL